MNDTLGAEASWQTVSAPGAELAWTAEGHGPTVLWAHGVSSSSYGMDRAGMFDWSPIVASGRTLVRYDARGHGRSTGHGVPGDWRFAHLGQDLLRVADAVSPDAPVSGIGSSLGTASLLYAALARPDRFERLVLTSPPTAWETRPAQAGMYTAAADLVEARGAAAFTDLVAQAASPAIFQSLPGYPPAQEIDESLLPAVLRGIGASDLPDREELRGLRLPVLILAWDTDPGHPVSTAQQLAELIPGAELEIAETLQQMSSWGTRAAEFLTR